MMKQTITITDIGVKQWNGKSPVCLSFTYRFSKGIKFEAAKKK